MADTTRVTMETDKGVITLEVYADKAPLTVKNFLAAVDAGHYDGTIFHRVIKGFMVQGGGMDETMDEKDWDGEPVRNEAKDALTNERGTLAMARTMDPHSATVQFFINTVDNEHLDHSAETMSGYGYCAFGRVVEGLDVVDAIEAVKTTTRGGNQNVPVETVRIIKAARA